MEPYPGLRPFRREEAELFFGRDQLVEHLAQRLSRERIATLAGPSGSGKSSIVRAGLLPFLEDGGGSRGGAHWCSIVVRLGSDPLRTLSEALTGDLNALEGLLSNESDSRSTRHDLADLIRRRYPVPDQSTLLVIDQFEEVFRSAWQPSSLRSTTQFLGSTLTELAGDFPCPLYVLLVMRTDFLGDCNGISGLTQLVNRGLVLVPPLSKEERLAAIERPAQVGGASIEQELVTRLLADTEELGPDQLALMQHALKRLWARASFRLGPQTDDAGTRPFVLTFADYQAIGGVTDALRLEAEAAFFGLHPEEQKLAEGLFRCLTASGDFRRTFRRPGRLRQIASELQNSAETVERVARTFCQEGLLTCSEPAIGIAEDPVFDISHEAVIRQWARLQHWVEAEGEAGERLSHLRQMATRHQGGTGALLQGPELAFTLQWLSEAGPTVAWAERYGGGLELTKAYVDASSAAEESEKRKVEQGLPQRGGVFICYRREDAADAARYINRVLGERFGPGRVFMDVVGISPGSDFETVLDAKLTECSVTLVLIGETWLSLTADGGESRLHQPSDYVRREIREAISRKHRVVPVLLKAARIPDVDKLPKDIAPLSKLQGIQLRHETFDQDLERLAQSLKPDVDRGDIPSKLGRGLTRALQWTRLVPRH